MKVTGKPHTAQYLQPATITYSRRAGIVLREMQEQRWLPVVFLRTTVGRIPPAG